MKYFKLILLTVVGLSIFSCDVDEFLNPVPETSLGQNGFFTNDAEIQQGINGVYDAIQGVNEFTSTNWNTFNRGIQFEYLLTEHRSDNTKSSTTEGSKADFHRYLVIPDNVENEDYYASMYEIIFRANNILSVIDNADPDNIVPYTAELRFLRGYAYFNLVRLYGDVPLVTSVVNPDDTDAVFTRVDVSTVYAQIVDDLSDAVTNLSNGGSKGRASRAAAQALLAKVYLSQPSPNYLEAQQLLETIINSNEFSLMTDFSDVFYSELNDELIFVVEFIAGNALESQSYSAEFTSREGRQDGMNILEPNLVTALDTFGGTRAAATYYIEDNEPTSTKFLPDGFGQFDDPAFGPTTQTAGNDWIILRYADVLLMHAEAILAGNQSTTSQAAMDSVNEVRNRAGLGNISGNLTADDLLLERRMEFAIENHRFYDLMRFGVANTVLSAYAAESGYDYNVNQLLLPIPAFEINQSDGLLTQNPGY